MNGRARLTAAARLGCGAALALACAAAARGQGPAAADPEREAVRKVVESYLYAEEAGEKKGTLLEDARIVFFDYKGERARAEVVSRRGAGKPRGARTASSPQKIVSIEVLNDAASVKVETVLMPDTPNAIRHTQYLWLLRTGGGWRIAGILMPNVAPAARPAGS